MKSILIILIFVVCCSINLLEQDIITLTNGDEIQAQVIEINTTEISYKKFENLQGPTYKVLKSEVFKIKYPNGNQDIITSLENNTSRVDNSKDNKLKFNNSFRFYMDNVPYSYSEVESMMKLKNNTKAIELFSSGVKNKKSYKPLTFVGLGLGIGGFAAGTYFGIFTLLNNLGDPDPSSQDPFINSVFKPLIIPAYLVSALGWTSFTYGLTLKSKSKKQLQLSAEEYNKN